MQAQSFGEGVDDDSIAPTVTELNVFDSRLQLFKAMPTISLKSRMFHEDVILLKLDANTLWFSKMVKHACLIILTQLYFITIIIVL